MDFSNFRLTRVILELRYRKGFLYWDRCGATLLEIQKKYPKWKWESTSVELTRLIDLQRNMEFLFNIRNIRFIQNEVENLNQFKKVTTAITPLIVDKLEIERFSRIGNRYMYVLPLKTLSEGREIIKISKAIEIPKERLAMFGKKSVKTSFTLHIDNEKIHYRIELTTIERIASPKNIKINEAFNPKYGLRIDVDIATLGEVKATTFDGSSFIQDNKKFLENNLVKFIGK